MASDKCVVVPGWTLSHIDSLMCSSALDRGKIIIYLCQNIVIQLKKRISILLLFFHLI